ARVAREAGVSGKGEGGQRGNRWILNDLEAADVRLSQQVDTLTLEVGGRSILAVHVTHAQLVNDRRSNRRRQRAGQVVGGSIQPRGSERGKSGRGFFGAVMPAEAHEQAVA